LRRESKKGETSKIKKKRAGELETGLTTNGKEYQIKGRA